MNSLWDFIETHGVGVQAVSTVVLAVLTGVYVVVTGRILRHTVEQAKQERAFRFKATVKGLMNEIRDIAKSCPTDGEPRRLPTHVWESGKADLWQLSEDAVVGLTDFYAIVRKCNTYQKQATSTPWKGNDAYASWAEGSRMVPERADGVLELLAAQAV